MHAILIPERSSRPRHGSVTATRAGANTARDVASCYLEPGFCVGGATERTAPRSCARQLVRLERGRHREPDRPADLVRVCPVAAGAVEITEPRRDERETRVTVSDERLHRAFL